MSAPSDTTKNVPGSRRIVKTARTFEDINAAARAGFWPLVKRVQPSKDIHQMVAVFQDPKTGQIELVRDVRVPSRWKMVVDYTLYYPYQFPSPFAAYLVPADIAIGEEVWLEDLIEDLVAIWGNQGYHPRLPSAPAVWNGSGFDIQFDPQQDAARWVG